jgi:thiosulfate dehydrogenase [quinone] large subunit
MTGTRSVTALRDRSAAFWLSCVATATLVVLYIGDVAAALGGGLTGFATFWNEGLLATPIAGVSLATIVAAAFWISSIALVVVLFGRRKEPGATDVDIEEPAFARFLFHSSRAGLLWLPVRLFLGVTWLTAGIGKLTDPAWRDGSRLAGFWASRLSEDGPITYDWYSETLRLLVDSGSETWFAWIISLGELAVGLGLIVGALTGIAAFFGALMNMSFMLAGSAATNPVLFSLAIGVMLAWRVAGYYGLDRYLLPKLGTPWRTGSQPPRST